VNQIGTVNNKGSVLSITYSVSKTSQDEWILDSGATDPVTTFSHLFSLCKKINSIIVRLPNGHTFIATHASRIQFSQFMYLVDVLYIPSFQFNLIKFLSIWFVCETCHHSKQKRLSFPNSDSYSSCAFALIHVVMVTSISLLL